MKTLLVSPESRVWNSRAHIHNGLGYLAGALIQAGYHEVDIFDGAVERESLEQRLEREPFDIVGISSPTPLIHEAWHAAQVAGAHGALTILGGPHPTLMPDESLQHPEVDFVARGEGEQTLVEFVRAVETLAGSQPSAVPRAGRLRSCLEGSEATFSNIRGLSYRKAAGEIMHNMPRALARDLDAIAPPAHHLFKIEQYTNLQPLTDGLDRHARAYTILTSRGCPYKCTYCSKPITGNTWRARSVDHVLAEWRLLVEELHATEIGITDDIWNLNLKRAKEICQGLSDMKLDGVPWITVHGMKVNHVDAELFQLMKRAGCRRVGFGVESGDEQILKRSVKKAQTLTQVRAAFRYAREAGLETMGFFIFGMPGETEETMERTIQLALELDPDLANFMLAAPYPGTELWDTVMREGKLFARNWGELAIHSDHAHFELGALTPALVERKWHEAYRRFYFRPQRVAARLRRADTWRNLWPRMRDAWRFLTP
jgi:radical SAM superfamily enzyme YgiQ (UPF0313 family)